MLLEELWEKGCALIPAELRSQLTVKGLWDTRLYFQPQIHERVFASRYLLAQTHYQGCCFYQGPPLRPQSLSSLIGHNYQEAREACLPIRIAVLDSLFGFGRRIKRPTRQLMQEGTPTEKALWRAKIVGEEVQSLAPLHSNITILGVSGLIVYRLMQLGYEVSACDLHPALAQIKLPGNITILNGSHQERCIRNAEVAIVTGMALATETMENVLRCASNHNTKVIIYAQTGANLAPQYLSYGARSVICELIPFYNFEGISKIFVYRR